MTTYGFKALRPKAGGDPVAERLGVGPPGAPLPQAQAPQQPPTLAAAKADREHRGQWPVMAAEFVGAHSGTLQAPGSAATSAAATSTSPAIASALRRRHLSHPFSFHLVPPDDLADVMPCVYALGDAASVGDRQYAATAQARRALLHSSR